MIKKMAKWNIFLTEIDGEMADDGGWCAADRDYGSAGLNVLST